MKRKDFLKTLDEIGVSYETVKGGLKNRVCGFYLPEYNAFAYTRRYGIGVAQKRFPNVKIWIYKLVVTKADVFRMLKGDLSIENYQKRFDLKIDDYSKTLEEYAEENRNNPTDAEKEFEKILIENKVQYKTQVPIKRWIADFVLYGQLVVEIDGGYHSEYDQIEKDRIKDKGLNTAGYCVIRVKNEEVFKRDFCPLLTKVISV